MSYMRHNNGAGFANGDPLIADDMNNIEIALVDHDGQIAQHTQTLNTVLSGINVLAVNTINDMIVAAETRAAELAAQSSQQGSSGSSSGDNDNKETDDNNG